MPDREVFDVYVQPGEHHLRVGADENVLGAALAAGIPLPHSCRAGRCATCKAKLLSGTIRYPDDLLPPGIVAAEAARGEVLLCQARPTSDLRIEARRVPVRAVSGRRAAIVAIDPLPFDALRVRVRLEAGALALRPGQFVDATNTAGARSRLAVISIGAAELELEAANDGSPLRDWLGADAVAGSALTLDGPFDAPR